MKTISYRGGLITFRVPATWKEEYQPEGGGTFYEDRPDAGTLRLNVITAKAPAGKLPSDGYSFFALKSFAKDERLTKTPHGDGMRIFKDATEERGTKIDLYCWEIAQCIPPETLRIATFTWTILASQSSDPKFQKEIEFLTNEISKAYFYPELG